MRCVWLLALVGCHTNEPLHVLGVPATRDVMRGDIYYDCDAATGHTSQWSRTIEPAGYVVGSLFISEVRHDDNWANFAGVMVSGPFPRNAVGINVDLDTSTMELRARLRVPDDSSQRVELGRAPTSGIRFALQWDANTLRARIDPSAPWSEVALPFKPERLWLVCATGNVVFHSVSVLAPPAAAPAPAAAEPQP